MRGGGELVGSIWLIQARLLRPGDTVRALNWNDYWWGGGEDLVVEDLNRIRDWVEFIVTPVACPGLWWWKGMLASDRVTLLSRDIPEPSTNAPKVSSRAGAGQLDLF